MMWRFLSFVLAQLVPAILALLLAPDSFARPVSALAAALAGAALWWLVDAIYGWRALRWLRSAQIAQVPVVRGMWAEALDRVRKWVLVRDRAIVESQHRLDAFLSALQASPNGVLLLDAQGRVEWLNQMASDHFGLDAQRDLQQHLGNLVRDPGFTTYYAARDYRHDVQMPGRKSTASKPVKLSVHLHPYGEGRCLLLSRDVTAVEQAEAMRRDFVANVSHEIRTPLTVLSGFVETLQLLSLPDEERQRYLELMSVQAQRMQTLVSDLLTLSRLEGSPLPPTRDWVTVDPLIAQCRQDAHDLSLVLFGVPGEVRLRGETGLAIAGSATELSSALGNLVGNAIRYSPPGKPVEVTWSRLPQGGALLSVKDEGPGIAPEHIPRLTERFYRVDHSRSRETGGTGLGLAIVKHVTQRHGAELSIESVPGKGAVFSIRFPAQRVRWEEAVVAS